LLRRYRCDEPILASRAAARQLQPVLRPASQPEMASAAALQTLSMPYVATVAKSRAPEIAAKKLMDRLAARSGCALG
jgi:hypothetical protein